jgi:prepilin-type N-terminal cleavage/methylation domain-containing protein
MGATSTSAKNPMKNLVKRIASTAFTLIELLVVMAIIAILASIALPVFVGILERGQQTKDLSNAKQIGLGLRLYSGDHDGLFPAQANPLGSNPSFVALIPQYIPTEKIFYLAKSAWTPTPPDELLGSQDTLRAGENNFAYVNNLTDTSNPSFPIVADGFSSDTVGLYATDETARGGVWKGKKAIVVRVDSSGAVETVASDLHVYGPTGAASTADIFVPSSTWLGSTQVPLNPQ